MRTPRPRRRWTWLWIAVAVAACIGWVLSHQLEKFAAGPVWYAWSGDGVVSLWHFSPANRTSIGLGPHETPGYPSHRSFFWIDSWGMGAGVAIWPFALATVAWAAWRYAFAGSRQFPPETRLARRTAAACVVLFTVSACWLLASARHNTCRLLSSLGCTLSLENGAVAIANPPDQAFFTTATIRTGFLPLGTPPASIPFVESRQGSWHIDLLPDIHFAKTDWRISFPLWPLVPVAAWLAWITLRKAARRSEGLCPACGYQLVGLPAGTPCPECGRGKPDRPKQPPPHPASAA